MSGNVRKEAKKNMQWKTLCFMKEKFAANQNNQSKSYMGELYAKIIQQN